MREVNNQHGYLLVDVMVATVIIVIAFAGIGGGILGIYAQSALSGNMANNKLIAYHLAQERLEEIQRSAKVLNLVTDTDDSVVYPTYHKTDNPFPYANVDVANASYADPNGRTETLPIKGTPVVFTRVTRATTTAIDATQAKTVSGNANFIKVTVTVTWNESIRGKITTNKVTLASLFRTYS